MDTGSFVLDSFSFIYYRWASIPVSANFSEDSGYTPMIPNSPPNRDIGSFRPCTPQHRYGQSYLVVFKQNSRGPHTLPEREDDD